MKIFSVVILVFLFLAVDAQALELIAHRGIYQNYGREDLDARTCTADRILRPVHSYLENTILSIRKAFELGADMVELDIHPTSEDQAEQNRLVVIHDWELTCRTNASCETGCRCNEKQECNTDRQPWSYLRILDIGYKYTADHGNTFPFRGKGVGLIPTFVEAVSLLAQYPERKLLVNVKDTYERTQLLLLKELSAFPVEIRSRVYVEFQRSFAEQFRKLSIPEAIWQATGSKKCFQALIAVGNPDLFPEPCRKLKFFVPYHQNMGGFDPKWKDKELVDLLPGWPDQFLRNAQKFGSEIYLSQVNNEGDLQFARSHQFSGFMTDRIERMGPLLKNGNSL